MFKVLEEDLWEFMRTKVLCIEDDLDIQALIELSLKEFSLSFVSTLKEAEGILAEHSYDAILLDIELPDGDGLKFFSKLTHDLDFKKIPTLILSGHDGIDNKLLAFTIGVDDFITKPFNPLELKARISSKIRKKHEEKEAQKLRLIGDLQIDFDRQKAVQIASGQEHDLLLTTIELKILSLLSKRKEQVYSRPQILQSVWGDIKITDRTVDSHIAHLRNKISASRVIIDTVKNLGYRLIVKSDKLAQKDL